MRFSLLLPLLLASCYAAPAPATKAITWGSVKKPQPMIWVEELEDDPDGCVAKVFDRQITCVSTVMWLSDD